MPFRLLALPGWFLCPHQSVIHAPWSSAGLSGIHRKAESSLGERMGACGALPLPSLIISSAHSKKKRLFPGSGFLLCIHADAERRPWSLLLARQDDVRPGIPRLSRRSLRSLATAGLEGLSSQHSRTSCALPIGMLCAIRLSMSWSGAYRIVPCLESDGCRRCSAHDSRRAHRPLVGVLHGTAREFAAAVGGHRTTTRWMPPAGRPCKCSRARWVCSRVLTPG